MRTVAQALRKYVARSIRVGDCIVYTGQPSSPYVSAINERGAQELLHRMSYRNKHKLLTYSGVVRHTCDTPKCWNPAHLIGGDTQDNVDDRVQRNRDFHTLGEDHHWAKVTDQQAAEAVAEYKSGGVTYQATANKYGVSRYVVSKWVRGLTRQRRLS